MSDKWKNRILFWILAGIVPGAILFMVSKLYGSNWFVAFLVIYYFQYRPYINISRLLSLNAIEEKDAWKLFIPFHDSRYAKRLWFG